MSTFELERVKLFHLPSFPNYDELLLAECEALSFDSCDNLWIPSDQIGRGSHSAIEILVAHLYKSITQALLKPDFAGVELWVQKYEQGKGLAFHFDKDEHALRTRGTMKHPQYSSVVYLTGDRARQRQAPTVVIDQLYDAASGRAVPDTPTSCVLCWPRKGNVLIFDGGHAHGVLESANVEDVRMTLLVNWWSERPMGIPSLPEATGETAAAVARIQAQHADEKRWLSASIDDSTAGAEALLCQSVLLKSLEEPISVDQACDDRDVALRGPAAVDAVCFQHPGMSLVPLEVAHGDDVDCAAALLPCDSDQDD